MVPYLPEICELGLLGGMGLPGGGELSAGPDGIQTPFVWHLGLRGGTLFSTQGSRDTGR